LPIVLRWEDVASLRAALTQSLLEPEFADHGDALVVPPLTPDSLFLAAKTLLGLQPAFAVAVVDADGRLRFKETLCFSFEATPGGVIAQARPDRDTARRLKRLSDLLTDKPVYTSDERSSDLDGLRQPLGQALRVQSLAPLLARRAWADGVRGAQTLLDWVSRDFDAAEDPAARARFLRRAMDWTPDSGGASGS
jgi:hypothetical protein